MIFELVLLLCILLMLLLVVFFEIRALNITTKFFKSVIADIENSGLEIFDQAHPCDFHGCTNMVRYDDIPFCSDHPYKEEHYKNYSYKQTQKDI